MKVIKGNKTIETSRKDFASAVFDYKRTEVDLGTGDGRFVYQKSKENPETFFVGIDPSEKQMEIYSKKAVREKVQNVAFVLGSLEMLPEELQQLADKVYINFPWGSLLRSLIIPTADSVKTVKSLLRGNGQLEIVLGYDPQAEPSEIKRLNLPEISEEYIKNTILPAYEKEGFKLTKMTRVGKEDLPQIGTSWSKKLKYGNERPVFRLVFSV